MSGSHGLRANAQDGRLARRANPEMAVIQQEIDAVFLELDRIGFIVRHALHYFDRGYLDFKTAGRALIGVDAPRDNHAGFLRQAAQGFKCRRLVFE